MSDKLKRNPIDLLASITGIERTVAEQLLTQAGSVRKLAQMSTLALGAQPGIGPATSTKIHAMTQWAIAMQQPDGDDLPQLRTPKDVYNLLGLELSVLEQLEMRVLSLDGQNRVIKQTTLYQGSVNMAIVRISEVMRDAIILNATGIIIAINLPSAKEPEPNRDTIAIAKGIYDAGKLMDIKLNDFLIFAGAKYTSMQKEGLIPCELPSS